MPARRFLPTQLTAAIVIGIVAAAIIRIFYCDVWL
jgi:hypothetical protein